MKITAQMIADRAGVSRGTVDRALHDRGQIDPAVKNRILKIAEELDYHPNRAGRALVRSGRKYRVLVVTPGATSYPWQDRLCHMETACHQYIDYGFWMEHLATSGDRPEELSMAIRNARLSKPDYMVVAAYDHPDVLRELKSVRASHIPLLTFDSTIENNPALCHIGSHYNQDGRTMAGLFHLYYRHDAPVLASLYRDRHHWSSNVRMQAFEQELKRLKQRYQLAGRFPISGQVEAAYEATHRMLTEHPHLRALYIASGNVVGVAQALDALGLKGKIPLFAYDLTGHLRRYLDDGTAVATLCQSNHRIAELVFKTIYDHLIYGMLPQQKQILVENVIKLPQCRDEYSL